MNRLHQQQIQLGSTAASICPPADGHRFSATAAECIFYEQLEFAFSFFPFKKTSAEVEAAVQRLSQLTAPLAAGRGAGEGAAPLPGWCRPSAERAASWRRSDWFRVQRDSVADTGTQNPPPPQPSQLTASEPTGRTSRIPGYLLRAAVATRSGSFLG